MILNIVKNELLDKNKIKEEDIFSVLSDFSSSKINYSDIYFQFKNSESWVLEDSIIKNGSYNIDQGIGMRIIYKKKIGFSYSNEITLDSLTDLSKSLKNVFDCNKSSKKIIIKPIISLKKRNYFYGYKNPLDNLSNNKKINILKIIDFTSRSYSSKIVQVRAKLFGSYEYVLVASTDGIFSADIRPLVNVSIEVLAENKGRSEIGLSGGGSRNLYDYFFSKNNLKETLLQHWSKEACRIAILNLSAKTAPSGTYPVVLGSGWPGVLLHEAVGHGLEGDFNRKKISNFSNKMGSKVASKLCTIVDNGTLKNAIGSVNIDDEGISGMKNVLIKNGILKKYMQDKFNSFLMGLNITGNGRRQSYAHLPYPRMTNTYMLSGTSNFKEIIESIDYGIYAVNFSGGQVDIITGEFVFSTLESYLICKGKILYPIKKVTLIGSGIKIMNSISMVGNDLKMDSGTGTCIKEGQSIPVCVGQPTIKIDKLTIGGGA
ncbi:metalloprotease TldD [Buchnera aphidicola]|uniref:metalloprotease TldD n=1 Tax=Buchnera aphidicola TaxID=9 RepID=UPI0030EF777A